MPSRSGAAAICTPGRRSSQRPELLAFEADHRKNKPERKGARQKPSEPEQREIGKRLEIRHTQGQIHAPQAGDEQGHKHHHHDEMHPLARLAEELEVLFLEQ